MFTLLMRNWKETLSLYPLAIKVKLKQLATFWQERRAYHTHSQFRKVDQRLFASYLWQNPYRTCHRFFQHKGQGLREHYGETPLSTLATIAREANLSKEDVVFELGSGRGRACFWLALFIGCEVHGIELVPRFIEKAERIKGHLRIDNLHFHRQNYLEGDYRQASFVYCYGTCLEDEAIWRLSQKLEGLPSGAQLLTISYPLQEIEPNAPFQLQKTFPVSFPWGETMAYLQKRI
ncbi:MAG: hypothetical protein K0S07_1597 [Chlamydiales bacterium]|jgi:SAM-dependent methyltransferase|nr:hypothetical protein [Chlamydiales bacterium]